MGNKLKHPLQFDSVCQILRKIIGKLDEVDSLASHICDEEVDAPLPQLISRLLEKNIHVHTLLTALSACERSRLQYTFDSAKALPLKAQLASAKIIINHFNTIQDAFIAGADVFYDDMLQRTKHNISNTQSDTGNRSMGSNQEEEQSYQQTLSNSVKQWEKNKSISIRNYYHGLTIRADTPFISKESDSIQIQLNDDVAKVFAVHPSEMDAFAVCHDEKTQIRLSIVDASNGIAKLKLGQTFPIYTEDRKHLNIQVQEQMSVTIGMRRKKSQQARLHDLSIGGLGVSILGTSESPYDIGDRVTCKLPINKEEITINGIVRWIGNNDEEARIGIEIDGSSSTQHLIQKEIFRMQRNIINSIHELKIPDTLAKGLN